MDHEINMPFCGKIAGKETTMNESFLEQFPASERNQRRKIEALMDAWKKELSTARVRFKDDGEYYSGDNFFCADGFFPYYYQQKRKILFIAREAAELSGIDFIEEFLGAYRKNDIGGQTLNLVQNSFHNRMLCLAWGILQDGMVPYEEVPQASEVGRTFGTPEGISFAFMELSKYSNDSENGHAHYEAELMTAFLKDSRLDKRNFFREELDILDPDLVITMNLWGTNIDGALLELALGEVIEDDSLPKYKPSAGLNPYAGLNSIEINKRKVPLIETYHFSARKDTEEWYYNPVMEIIREMTH
jgi:hypothetical protein